jgi:hypothetical protein
MLQCVHIIHILVECAPHYDTLQHTARLDTPFPYNRLKWTYFNFQKELISYILIYKECGRQAPTLLKLMRRIGVEPPRNLELLAAGVMEVNIVTWEEKLSRSESIKVSWLKLFMEPNTGLNYWFKIWIVECIMPLEPVLSGFKKDVSGIEIVAFSCLQDSNAFSLDRSVQNEFMSNAYFQVLNTCMQCISFVFCWWWTGLAMV